MPIHGPGQAYRIAGLQRFLKDLTRLPSLWQQRVHYRRNLANLDAAQIKDAGLDPDRIRAEITKFFWEK